MLAMEIRPNLKWIALALIIFTGFAFMFYGFPIKSAIERHLNAFSQNDMAKASKILETLPWTIKEQVERYFLSSLFIFGTLIAGTAFSSFRKENSTKQYLLVPASTLEKFISQVVFRLVLFILLFPVLFHLLSDLVIYTMSLVYEDFQFKAYSFFDSSLWKRTYRMDYHFFIKSFLASVPILYFTFLFWGTVHFGKKALLKSLAVVAIFIILFNWGDYMYMHSGIKRYEMGIEHTSMIFSQAESSKAILPLFITCSFSIVLICSAYFKLKEKEV
ncbi:hypothetical protein FUAX_35980 [Fulvitalea axinellae]|uniref:ABC transporter permease n=1 Tax=Fulvitalea axinellae TaxID=1182444 RepID=A0AAU9CGA0_9BACT|nr:hypothetical protein FUAX_35980 [Fulvitalea axinellae]